MLIFNEVSHSYFGKCLEVTNGSFLMKITIDKGPRIIHYSLNGKENILCEDILEKSTMSGGKFSEVFGEKKWYIYGGHRLWFSPEHNPRSYYPDNDKVSYKVDGKVLTLTPPPQVENDLQFEMVLTFDEVNSNVKILHKVTNLGHDIKTLSAWPMTCVAENSLAILPQSTKDTGLLSNRNLSLWAYTNVSDERLFISNKYITILQIPDHDQKLKVGYNNIDGWLAVVNKDQLFVKEFPYDENVTYPDNNCNCECFTNDFMMEVESLSELKSLGKGEFTESTEFWSLKECNTSINRLDENSIDNFVKSNII